MSQVRATPAELVCVMCGHMGDDVELVFAVPLCGPCDDAETGETQCD